MKTIDTRGHLCPTPLIMTKKAIKESGQGETIEVISDNDTSKCNLLDYIAELGYQAECMTAGSEHRIIFTLDSNANNAVNYTVTEYFCPAPTPLKGIGSGYTIVLKSRYMGDGSVELGAMLMRACVNSLGELDRLPKSIVMYNEGVMLAVTGCDTADSIKKLSDMGVEIIVCGTCVDFYGIKDQLAVGTISNMYKINTILSESDNVIYP